MQRRTDCKLDCKLTTLSPLHIGSGEVYTGLDYHIDDDYLYLIDIHDISKYLIFDKGFSHDLVIEDVRNTADRGQLDTLINEYEVPFEKLSKQKIKLFSNPYSRDEIHAFIKGSTDNKKNYIPGSSLKGAVRTAIIWNYYKNNLDDLNQDLSNKSLEYVENNIIGKDSNSLMKFLAVSDSMNEDKSECESKIMEIKVVSPDVRTKNIEKKLSVFYECINENEEFKLQVNLLKSKANNVNLDLIYPENIIVACNEFSKYQIIEDCKYISTYNFEESHLFEFYKNLIETFNSLSQNEAIVHLGWGTGWLSKTFTSHIKDQFPGCFDKQNKQHKVFGDRKNIGAKYFPKTRRFVVQHNEPISSMGWVKIVFPEEKIEKHSDIMIDCSQYLKNPEKNKPINNNSHPENKTAVKRGDKLQAKIIKIGHMADIEITEEAVNVQKIIKQVRLPYGPSFKIGEHVTIKIEKLRNNEITKCKIVSS